MTFCKIFIVAIMLLFISHSGMSQASSKLSNFYRGETVQIISPGSISTRMGEYSPTFDVQRNELYFMRRTPGKFDYTIYTSQLTDNGWSEPKVVSFSGQYRDAAPYLSPDGNVLLFDSRRPDSRVASNTINLWSTKRKKGMWSEPELLEGPSINKEDNSSDYKDEYGPAIDNDGTLYFYSFRPPYRGGSRYISSPPDYKSLQVDERIPDPSARTFISYLYISPDGDFAVMEGRAKGRNDTDLFCSEKKSDGIWTTPYEIPNVNTVYSEGGPFVTSDGQFLLFTSNRPASEKSATNANLYITSMEKIQEYCLER